MSSAFYQYGLLPKDLQKSLRLQKQYIQAEIDNNIRDLERVREFNATSGQLNQATKFDLPVEEKIKNKKVQREEAFRNLNRLLGDERDINTLIMSLDETGILNLFNTYAPQIIKDVGERFKNITPPFLKKYIERFIEGQAKSENLLQYGYPGVGKQDEETNEVITDEGEVIEGEPTKYDNPFSTSKNKMATARAKIRTASSKIEGIEDNLKNNRIAENRLDMVLNELEIIEDEMMFLKNKFNESYKPRSAKQIGEKEQLLNPTNPNGFDVQIVRSKALKEMVLTYFSKKTTRQLDEEDFDELLDGFTEEAMKDLEMEEDENIARATRTAPQRDPEVSLETALSVPSTGVPMVRDIMNEPFDTTGAVEILPTKPTEPAFSSQAILQLNDFINDVKEGRVIPDNRKEREYILSLQNKDVEDLTRSQLRKAINIMMDEEEEEDIIPPASNDDEEDELDELLAEGKKSKKKYKLKIIEKGKSGEEKETSGSGIFKMTKTRNGSSFAKPGRRLIFGKGLTLQREEKYVPFGKFIINQHLLMDNVLQIKYPSMGRVLIEPINKNLQISENAKEFLKDFIENKRANKRKFDKLTADEKSFMMNLIKASKLNDFFKIKPSKYEEEDKKYQVLLGQIRAGNNNPDLIRQLTLLLTKFIEEGRIDRTEGKEIVQQLLNF